MIDLQTIAKTIHAHRILRMKILKCGDLSCGLRPSVLGQDRSRTKKIGLISLVLCCETRSCYARRHNDLEGHTNFVSTIYSNYSVLETSLLWRSTVAFTYLKVESAKYLCLLPMVLVLRIWSCLHHLQVAATSDLNIA